MDLSHPRWVVSRCDRVEWMLTLLQCYTSHMLVMFFLSALRHCPQPLFSPFKSCQQPRLMFLDPLVHTTTGMFWKSTGSQGSRTNIRRLPRSLVRHGVVAMEHLWQAVIPISLPGHQQEVMKGSAEALALAVSCRMVRSGVGLLDGIQAEKLLDEGTLKIAALIRIEAKIDRGNHSFTSAFATVSARRSLVGTASVCLLNTSAITSTFSKPFLAGSSMV